ncbi:MAG: hypothetical protein R2874_05190 [Desulfobacterales bacterium]
MCGKDDPEQAREAMAESQQEFIARCKEILTEAETTIIFGLSSLKPAHPRQRPRQCWETPDKIELGFKNT